MRENEPDLRKVLADVPWSAIIIPLVLALIICAAFVVIVFSQ